MELLIHKIESLGLVEGEQLVYSSVDQPYLCLNRMSNSPKTRLHFHDLAKVFCSITE